MNDRNCMELLRANWAEDKLVCVGLDSDVAKIPTVVQEKANEEYKSLAKTAGGLLMFNRMIIDSTADLTCAYKPNFAFYEKLGAPGIEVLRDTIRYIRAVAPSVVVIGDGKRGDIGNTNDGYVAAAFDYFDVDAITVHPYLGQEALAPFLNQRDKCVFVLCKTSNPGAGEFQDARVPNEEYPEWGGRGLALYEYVARRVAKHWNGNQNCGLVVGATYPQELQSVREITGDLPILIPGIGAQGGDLEATVRAGMDSQKVGFIINSSRGIIFASNGPDFAEAARRETIRLHEAINNIRLTA